MLTEICQETRNWFKQSSYYGKFTITDGIIDLSELNGAIKDGQYIRIIGSTFNDGVWQYPTQILQDETFDGCVWGLGIPPAFLKLASEIEDWQKKYGDVNKLTPYDSESFGGYSYTKSTGANGESISWKNMYSSQLNRWRKIL